MAEIYHLNPKQSSSMPSMAADAYAEKLQKENSRLKEYIKEPEAARENRDA
jgi:hypothetical protein